MEHVVAKTIDEMLKRMEDLDTRSTECWGCLELHFKDASTALQERKEAVDARIASLENFASA